MHLNKILSHANQVRKHLDTRRIPSRKDTVIYKEHLRDCRKYITAGLIARQQIINKNPKKYPAFFERNLQKVKRDPTVKLLKAIINDVISVKYNRTRFIRDYIIKDNRLDLKTVKKSRPYTKYDKFIIFLKQIFRF